MNDVKTNVAKYVDPKNQKDVAEALVLLEKKRLHDDRVKKGEIKGNSWKTMTEEQKAKRRLYNKNRNIEINELAKLAKAAGLKVK